MVMEMSWNFWNFEILKFSGISGKVMEFWLKLGRVMKKSWNFGIRANCHGIWQKIQWRGHGFLRFSHGKVLEKSWNFVAKISWQPCNHFQTFHLCLISVSRNNIILKGFLGKRLFPWRRAYDFFLISSGTIKPGWYEMVAMLVMVTAKYVLTLKYLSKM